MQPEVKRLFERIAEGKKQSVAFQEFVEEVAEARVQTDSDLALLQLEMQRARLPLEWRSARENVWEDVDRQESLPTALKDVEVDPSALSADEPQLADREFPIASR